MIDSRFHVELAVASQSERLTRRMVSLQAEYSELAVAAGCRAVDRDTREPASCAGRHDSSR
ncbi:hypothetical protein [Aeromicrobium sp. UC242_57]|uniref:hypothetical protein n=1 Tax=Aeromicrobium sp. UC242_57 TaxID=3374624 RepID=UPI0037C07B9D